MPNGLYNLPTNLDLPYWISALGPTARLGSTELGQAETIGIAYLESGTSPYGESLRAFTDAEKANVLASLAAVSDASGLEFVFVDPAEASVRIAVSDYADAGSVYGRTWSNTSSPVITLAYDAVYDSADGLANNSYIYIHELMHAVGLNHLTLTSERVGTSLYGSWTSAWQDGLQLFDTAAMQYLYGVDPTQRAGNDTYDMGTLGAFSQDRTTRLNDPLIWDGAGKDTIDLSSAMGAAQASLTPGVMSRVGTTSDLITDAGTFSINYGTQIEKLIGTDYSDTLSGSTAKDKLIGGLGDDTLLGLEGNDKLAGAKGDDSLIGDAGKDKLIGGAGNDTLSGGAQKDKIVGGADDDMLSGGGGRDRFVFAANDGADTITDFRSGKDRIVIKSGAESIDDITFSDAVDAVTLSYAATSVTLEGVALSDLAESDFLFL